MAKAPAPAMLPIVLLLTVISPPAAWAQLPVPAQPDVNNTPVGLSKDWKKVESSNFTVVGNASGRELQATAVEMERLRDAFATLFPDLSLTAAVPTMVVVLRDDGALTRFKPRDRRGRIQKNVAGYFAAHPDLNYMVLAARRDRAEMFTVVLHEYTHFVVHRTMQRVPHWLNEGLAEFYSTFDVDDEGRGIIGKVPAWRAETLVTNHLAPLDDLLTSAGAAKLLASPADTAVFYAESWALTHYLVMGPTHQRQLRAYIDGLNKGLSVEAAFREAFNTTFGQMQVELDRYIRQPRLPGLRIPLPANPASVSDAAPLRDIDALALQGDLLMRAGAHDDAEKLLQQVLKTEPRNVVARIAHAGVRLRQGHHDEALEVLKAVTHDTPDRFAAQYMLARTLTDAGRLEEALTVFDTALRLNKRTPQVWFEMSVVAVALDRALQGEGLMNNVLRLDSDPDWYRARALRLYELGKYEGVVRDSRAYLDTMGWASDDSAYAAFLEVLAYWHLERPNEAAAAVEQLTRALDPKSWPAAVTEFLAGRLQPDALLQRAKGNGEDTEAHAYIGLKAAIEHRTADAVRHLTWVRDRGSRDYTEYGLAAAELKRLTRP